MRRLRLALLILFLAWAAPAWAQVQIHFYSKDLDASFPHAFVHLTGTIEETGEPVDANYGFTAVRVTPEVLFGAVRGKIISMDARYIARSDRHFTLTLSDDQYRTVLALVDRWRNLPQPSYRLNSRNCVFFVAEVAAALGLDADPERKLMKKPKSFLQHVLRQNSALIARWTSRSAHAGR